MKKLTDYSREELQAALAAKDQQDNPLPVPLPNPDFSALIKITQEGIKEIAEQGYEDDDFSHYVYEAAMKAIYGDGYFDWFNSVVR